MAGWSLLSSLSSNVISERISLSSISKSELPCARTFHHSRELTECISFCSYLSYLYTQDFVVAVHSFLCLLSVSSHQRGEVYASGELVCLGHHYITSSCQNAWIIADIYYYFPSGWAKKWSHFFLADLIPLRYLEELILLMLEFFLKGRSNILSQILSKFAHKFTEGNNLELGIWQIQ